jgi:hypothetical protein
VGRASPLPIFARDPRTAGIPRRCGGTAYVAAQPYSTGPAIPGERLHSSLSKDEERADSTYGSLARMIMESTLEAPALRERIKGLAE